jgi:hypothetical protein
MTWEAAIESVNQDIAGLVKHFEGKKIGYLSPVVLALKVLMARERISIRKIQKQTSMVQVHEA